VFQQWNFLQSTVVFEIVDGDDVDGGGDFTTYDEPFVDEPDEVEVPNLTFIKLLNGFSLDSKRLVCCVNVSLAVWVF
jgi:hypothetical protein